MIIHTGSFPVREGAIDEVGAALLAARERTLQEPGCQRYDFAVALHDPNRITFHEVYDDRAAFDAHMAADHTRQLLRFLRDHLDGRPDQTTYRAEVVEPRGDGGG